MSSQTTSSHQSARAAATRGSILDAAERLFAEHGIDRVTQRQIAAEARQGNNAAVNYHFGTTDDLLAAVVARHHSAVEAHRARLLADVAEGATLTEWLRCLVQSYTDHLQELTAPTWYARLIAQLHTDPSRRATLQATTRTSETLDRITMGLATCLPRLPEAVVLERTEMSRLLVVHVLAERETALARGATVARDTWSQCASGLVDALAGLWAASVTDGVSIHRVVASGTVEKAE